MKYKISRIEEQMYGCEEPPAAQPILVDVVLEGADGTRRVLPYPDEALRREVREELGVTEFTPERLTQYIFDSVRERELVYVNRTVYDGPDTPRAEPAGGRIWTIGEILRTLGTGLFTPNFESEFRRVFLTDDGIA